MIIGKIINLMLGGPTAAIPPLTDMISPSSSWIGVDHGIVWLLDHHIIPKIGLGDFDSLSQNEAQRVDQQLHDQRFAIPEKDFTDSQWGITTAFNELNADKVHIYGATGGRLDHELVNLFTMTMPDYLQWLRSVKIIDCQNEISFYGPGQYQLNEQSDYPYLAFVSLTAIKELTLSQVKYPLVRYSASFPTSWASNEFLPGLKAQFSFSSGVVAVIRSKDDKKRTNR